VSRRTIGFGVAFLALAALVQATDFERVNSFAVDHLQPWAGGKGHPRLRNLADLVVSPAAPATTVVLIGLAALYLWARGRPRAAVAWPVALLMAFGVEILAKVVVSQHRSAIWRGFGLTFDSSFPSGHMLRAILLAGAATAVWHALRAPMACWCAAVAVCLLISGFHLPTDIAGGALAGLALASWAADHDDQAPEDDLDVVSRDFRSGSREQFL
jgi:membrane-associated phospholipid phosphatase